MKKALIPILLFSLSIAALAHDKVNDETYEIIRQITSSSGMPYNGQARRSLHLVGHDGDERFECVVRLADNSCADTLRQMGVSMGHPSNRIATARIPVRLIENVLQSSCVEYLEAAEYMEPMNDEARRHSNVDSVQAGNRLQGIDAYTGSGVIVGIIDEGFDLSHPAFMNSRQSASRIVSFWNQRGDTINPPSGFDYGSTYSGNLLKYMVIGTEYNASSHGTHVAGTAAGSDPHSNGRWRGMAPEADIVLVGTTMSNAAIMDGLSYITQYADSMGQPCVINLSLASYSGERDGTRPFDQFVNGLVGPGHLIVGAAGNTASYEHLSNARYGHIQAEGQNDSLSHAITEYYYTGSFGTQHGAIAWGRDPDTPFRVEVLLVTTQGSSVSRSYMADLANGTGKQTYKVAYPADSTCYYGTITTQIQRSKQNNKYYAQVFWNLHTMKSTKIYLRIYPDSCSLVDMWPTKYSAYFKSGDNISTICNTGGMGDSIISVGAYFSRKATTTAVLDSICHFSSHGPRIDGLLKPEIAAPGGSIISAYSRFYADGRSNWVDSTQFMLSTYPYGSMQGTSMSAPHVAGILATWLQANPKLCREDVINIFRHTAISDGQTGPVPNNTWGYGKIDAWAGLKAAIRLAAGLSADDNGPHDNSGLAGNYEPGTSLPFMMRQTGNQIEIVYTRSAQADVRLFDASGKLLHVIRPQHVGPATEHHIDTTPLPHGIYLLRIRADQQQSSIKIAL